MMRNAGKRLLGIDGVLFAFTSSFQQKKIGNQKAFRCGKINFH